MKQHKITAMLLALCTLLSVTVCADRSSAEDQIESTAEHSADFTDSEDNGSRGDESKAEDSGEAAQTTVTQQPDNRIRKSNQKRRISRERPYTGKLRKRPPRACAFP